MLCDQRKNPADEYKKTMCNLFADYKKNLVLSPASQRFDESDEPPQPIK
jgi:hypothetical protein